MAGAKASGFSSRATRSFPKRKRFTSLKEFAHLRRGRRVARKLFRAQRFQYQPQRALVLIERGGSESCFDAWPGHHHRHLPAAVRKVGYDALVENHDEQSILLKRRVGQERSEVGFEPGIRLCQRSIVSVIECIGRDKREVWQLIRGEV